MGAINNDWLEPLSEEFKKPYYKKLYDTVKSEYEARQIFPAAEDIFNAFEFTPLSEVKVVLFGKARCGNTPIPREHLSGAP